MNRRRAKDTGKTNITIIVIGIIVLLAVFIFFYPYIATQYSDFAPIVVVAITLILLILQAFIPAEIALKKGYSYGGFFVFGFFFFLIALIVVIFLKPQKAKVNVDAQLSQLERMKADGNITEEEYLELRKNLLIKKFQ